MKSTATATVCLQTQTKQRK